MRPSWDKYFMDIAELTAKRSTCIRRKVGAVLVKENRIMSTGYNGVPKGLKHCDQVGCLRDKLGIESGKMHELCRGIHAEQNTVIQAAVMGVSIKDSLIYTTSQPCILCTKILINAGIKKIIYKGEYPDKLSLEMLKEAKIVLEKFSQ